MTKKGKLILGWSIPALTVAVAAGLALPTIIFLESEKREILNSSTNAQPSSFIAFTETEQKELFFNSKDLIAEYEQKGSLILDIVGTAKLNHFRGIVTPQILVNNYSPCNSNPFTF